MTFWIIISGIALAIVGFFALAVLRGKQPQTEAASYDLKVYRDQLAEVDRDLARGVIGEDEAARVRTEVARRILSADTRLEAQAGAASEPGLTKIVVPGAALLLLLGGSLWIYRALGAPDYPDLPHVARVAASDAARASRMTQSEAEARLPLAAAPDADAEFLSLMERLRETVAQRPDDLQGLNLLANFEARLGNMQAAIDAQSRIIALRGDAAQAADHAYLAELLIGAASGYVSVEAEAALRRALDLDPRDPFARYYLAQYLMQVDRPDAAFRTLKALLDESTPEAPWVAPIRAQIEEVAWRAGVKYELPPMGGRGPSAEDIAAAQDMSAEDRDQMIRSMVARLSDRLTTEGGTPEEWSRLIRALGTLQEMAQANDIWTAAKDIFAKDEAALRLLYSAAQDAEITQ